MLNKFASSLRKVSRSNVQLRQRIAKLEDVVKIAEARLGFPLMPSPQKENPAADEAAGPKETTTLSHQSHAHKPPPQQEEALARDRP